MNDIATVKTEPHLKVDDFQRRLEQLPKELLLDLPLKHIFTPGLYVREIFMPKDSLVISNTHKSHHPYVIAKGKISVWTEADGVVHLEAPYTGVTRPGTRRILFMHEDCVFLTFHPTTETDIEKLEDMLFEKLPPQELSGEIYDQLKAA